MQPSGTFVMFCCSLYGDMEKRIPCRLGYFARKLLRDFDCRFSSALTSIGRMLFLYWTTKSISSVESLFV